MQIHVRAFLDWLEENEEESSQREKHIAFVLLCKRQAS